MPCYIYELNNESLIFVNLYKRTMIVILFQNVKLKFQSKINLYDLPAIFLFITSEPCTRPFKCIFRETTSVLHRFSETEWSPKVPQLGLLSSRYYEQRHKLVNKTDTVFEIPKNFTRILEETLKYETPGDPAATIRPSLRKYSVEVINFP